MTVTIAMTTRLVSPKDLAILHVAVARNTPSVECYCCREVAEVEEQLEGGNSCVSAFEAFQRLCLDKDVLYTSLVTMHTVRGDEVKLPLSNR